MPPKPVWDAGDTGPGGVGWQPNTLFADQSSSTPPASMSLRQEGQKVSITGAAHYIQQRQEDQQSHILTFRVECYDRTGNRLQPVPVEMRGYSITGFINEGDQVKVSGTWRGGLLRATRADNETTGAAVSAKNAPVACLAVGYIIVIFVFIFLAVIVLGVIFSH